MNVVVKVGGNATFLGEVKECSRSRDIKRGRELHSAAVASGQISHMFVVNSLINMYAKCGSMTDARKLFDRTPRPDVVSWNSLIMGYVKCGESEVALQTFQAMHEREAPNARSFVGALSACAALASRSKEGKRRWFEKGRELHAQAVKRRCCDVYVESTLVDMYAKCGRMVQAREVFEKMAVRGPVSWNSLLQGYVDNGKSELALELLEGMTGCAPDARTFVAGLSACSSLASQEDEKRSERCLRWLDTGKTLHARALAHRCCDIYVENTLIDMYCRCGCMASARKVFDGMVQRDVVSWTSLLQGYVENGENELALELYHSTGTSLIRDGRLYVVAISACTALAAEQRTSESSSTTRWLETGREMHSRAVESNSCDMFVQNKLIDFYAECGELIQARAVFDSMSRRDVVSWTALAMGYVKNGEHEDALEIIRFMTRSGVPRNGLTYVAALMACGDLMAVETGTAYHAELGSAGLDQDVVVANSLVDFYGKCGDMDSAKEVFERIPSKTVVSWTTLMSGYSLQGNTGMVFHLLEKMRESGVRPNEATFTCVLAACSHAGLTSRGKEYFSSMKPVYGLSPTMKHYTCLVDLLGRANCLEEALKVVKTMPWRPDVITWKTLLGACQKWRNVVVGQVAYESLLRLKEKEDSAYVLMASLYSGSVTDERSHTRKSQCLWTDENTGNVYRF